MTEAVDGDCAEGLLDSAATWRMRGTSGLRIAAAAATSPGGPPAVPVIACLLSGGLSSAGAVGAARPAAAPVAACLACGGLALLAGTGLRELAEDVLWRP